MSKYKSGPFDTDPKPFGKIDFPSTVSRREVTPHNRFSEGYTGRLNFAIKALTPIHVGSGVYELVRQQPIRGLISYKSEIRIPGTSLKGAIRSIAEAISHSCVRIKDGQSRDAPELSLPALRECPKLNAHSRSEYQCTCCRIFGGLGYQGRVHFSDAVLVEGKIKLHQLESPFTPHPEAPGYTDQNGRYNGRKFYYHGIPIEDPNGEPYQVAAPESEFDFHLDFENLRAEEFCLILTAMGALDDIVIKIGGGKAGMMGSAAIYLDRLELRDPARSFGEFSAASLIVEEEVTEFLAAKVGTANSLIDNNAFERLKEIWGYPSSRSAPQNAY